MAGKVNIIDLFSGVGGLSLGAARAGFTVKCAVELDKKAVNAHSLNFPGTTHVNDDVKTLTGDKLRELAGLNEGELAGIIGGPPCQGFSMIGQKDVGDHRNELFAEFFRLVSELKPNFFLAENVPGIILGKNKQIVDKAMDWVKDDYSMLPPMILSANNYGAPTTRTRVFFFGYRKDCDIDLSVDDFSPPTGTPKITVEKALRGLPKEVSPDWQEEEDSWRCVRKLKDDFFGSRAQGQIPSGVGEPKSVELFLKKRHVSGFFGTVHSKKVARRYLKVLPGQRDSVSKSQRLKHDGFCPTLRAGTGPEHGSFQAVRPLHPVENRVITPREAARLQGFPDWFQFSPTKWHSFRQIGNSVSPILAEYIFSVIKKGLGK